MNSVFNCFKSTRTVVENKRSYRPKRSYKTRGTISANGTFTPLEQPKKNSTPSKQSLLIALIVTLAVALIITTALLIHYGVLKPSTFLNLKTSAWVPLLTGGTTLIVTLAGLKALDKPEPPISKKREEKHLINQQMA